MATVITIHVEPTTKRSPMLVALHKRHSGGIQIHKDRRNPRGGNRNRQADYRAERY